MYLKFKWSLPVYFFEMDSLAFFSTIFGQFAISTFSQTLKILVQFFQLISVLSAFKTEMPVWITNRTRHVQTQSKFSKNFKFSANYNLNSSNQNSKDGFQNGVTDETETESSGKKFGFFFYFSPYFGISNINLAVISKKWLK